ncbi:MAG: hypothetical protein OHK0022_29440 [Roseiflexaceae bacterium]
MRRRVLLRGVQIAGTAVLVILLLRQLDWGALAQLPAQAHWGWLAAAALVLGLAHGLNILRWRGYIGPDAPGWATLTAMYGAGLFSNNFLPTGVGGDGVRVVLLSQHIPMPRALVAVGLDRLVGLAALLVLIPPGLLLGLPPGLDHAATAALEQRALPVALLGLAALGLGLAAWRWLPGLRQSVLRLAERPLSMLRAANWGEGQRTRVLAVGYGLSALGQICIAVAYYATLAGLSLPASAGAAIWLACSGALVLLVPITINGLGLMESTFVVVLGAYGIAATPAVAVALVSRALLLLFSLAGGLVSVYWTPRWRGQHLEG